MKKDTGLWKITGKGMGMGSWTDASNSLSTTVGPTTKVGEAEKLSSNLAISTLLRWNESDEALRHKNERVYAVFANLCTQLAL